MSSRQEKLTYEQILDSSIHSIIAIDAARRIVFISQKAAEILKLDKRKNIGSDILDLLPMTGKLFIKCLETNEPQSGRHILPNGSDLIANVTNIINNNRVLGAICTFEDKLESELIATKLKSYKQLNEQLNSIFQSASDGIWVCDGQGKIININRASESLFGINGKSIIGKNVGEVVKRGVFEKSITLEVLRTKQEVSVVQYAKKTKRYLLVTATPVFDKEGNIILVINNERDMTQMRAIQEQLEESLMVTEKLKDKIAQLSMQDMKGYKIVAESKQMIHVLNAAFKFAHFDISNILILGESGTGKGLLAKFIHKTSNRAKRPFIHINCGALPESLLEAELFGYERGAFTDAREQGKVGLFELAHEGTLFLDEIGDLPMPLQAKILKYLDDYEVMRLGGTKFRKIDCTIITATNRDLESLTKMGDFRKDLFYRLNTFPIRIPPLRERPEDIFELANYFLEKYNKVYKLKKRITQGSLKALQSYPFPGNVRELESIIKQALVMSGKNELNLFIMRSLDAGLEKETSSVSEKKHQLSLTEKVLNVERGILKNAMVVCKSTREMASYLRISQPTIVRKMKKYGLSR
jgi:PAS domain S-box-containing protein